MTLDELAQAYERVRGEPTSDHRRWVIATFERAVRNRLDPLVVGVWAYSWSKSGNELVRYRWPEAPERPPFDEREAARKRRAYEKREAAKGDACSRNS